MAREREVGEQGNRDNSLPHHFNPFEFPLSLALGLLLLPLSPALWPLPAQLQAPSSSLILMGLSGM